jgi:hypothetical protein
MGSLKISRNSSSNLATPTLRCCLPGRQMRLPPYTATKTFSHTYLPVLLKNTLLVVLAATKNGQNFNTVTGFLVAAKTLRAVVLRLKNENAPRNLPLTDTAGL